MPDFLIDTTQAFPMRNMTVPLDPENVVEEIIVCRARPFRARPFRNPSALFVVFGFASKAVREKN